MGAVRLFGYHESFTSRVIVYVSGGLIKGSFSSHLFPMLQSGLRNSIDSIKSDSWLKAAAINLSRSTESDWKPFLLGRSICFLSRMRTRKSPQRLELNLKPTEGLSALTTY